MPPSISLTQKAQGIFQIFRPELPTAAGVCVLLGEVLALGAMPPLPALGFGFACGFLLSGSALITNDYFDLEVDRINAPQRPLPAGILTPFEVMVLGLITALLGLAAASAFGLLAFGLSLIIWLLGFLYNWRLKAAGLWGNLIVALSVGITFVLGGIIVGHPWNTTVWTFALIALVFDLAEEIAGDAMDAEGDRQRASHSLALLYGRATALRISAALFGFVVLLTLFPWGALGLAYRIPILITDLLIGFFVIRLLRSQTPTAGRRAMRGLYLSGSLGLLAFLVGVLVGV
ncbi:UbiA family prenyltransferase [Candidatus Oscillochloris fontis]|uniref:UbiA family prenyltransferase n=1 Tax=Candidatus Oscillochloris fontis TaxID=2496868 RepID=UPI00101C2FCF|nr:UbiA family prenyltransferase [Candidatus Oscillochloris fontis]